MRDMTFVELLSGAVAAVGRDAPRCAQEMARTLGAVTIGIVVGHERVTLQTSAGAIRADPWDAAAAVHLAARRDAIIELVDGRRGLIDAVEAGTLSVAGSPAHLEAVDGALRWFLSGSVRSAGVRALWTRYRRGPAAAIRRVYES